MAHPHHQHLNHPPQSSRTLPHSQSSSHQHFQPWRNCIKTEKDQEVEGPARTAAFYPKMDLDSGQQRMSSMGLNVAKAYHPVVGYQPAATTALDHHKQPPLFAQLCEKNPELDQKVQQCIEEGNGVE